MANYIVFDNAGVTADRYTVIDQGSGNVFSAGDESMTCKFCGNCADHRITLYGAGWRQMPLSRRVIEAETENYIHNAQLNPSWLGKELPQLQWPKGLRDNIDHLVENNSMDFRSISSLPYIGPKNGDGKSPKTAMAH